jgi:fructooligosaccharide transport system permease protein
MMSIQNIILWMLIIIINLSLIALLIKAVLSMERFSRNTANIKIKKVIKRWFIFITYLSLSVLALIFLFPIVWMVMNSFKTHAEINANLDKWTTFLPSPNASNWLVSYKVLFISFTEFGRSIVNSFVYATITISSVLIINSLAGYAIARYRFPGSKALITIIILILIIPVETSIVPLYVILKNLGLLTADMRVVGYLIPGFAAPFYIFMFRAYFLGIPKELEEAAYIDGASRLRTFFLIIIPNALPVFATVAIFTFMGSWNEYIFAQLMFSNPLQQPVQVYLQLINSFNPKDMGMMMASLTFSTIPIALIYIFSQRYIVEGVAFTGGLK